MPDVPGAPCLGGHNRLYPSADGTTPVPAPGDELPPELVPQPYKMVDHEIGISSDAVKRKCGSRLCLLGCLV